jgi:uncharacterized protein
LPCLQLDAPESYKSKMSGFVDKFLYNRSLDFLNGRGEMKDPSEAFRLNSKAAERGFHDAVLAMGWYYLNGIGVPQDLDLARYWYTKSARSGEPKAMFSLGQMAYSAREWEAALRWFAKAADKGHARSLFWIGKLRWRGNGIDKDRREAMALFQRAADAKVLEAKRALRCLSKGRESRYS